MTIVRTTTTRSTGPARPRAVPPGPLAALLMVSLFLVAGCGDEDDGGDWWQPPTPDPNNGSAVSCSWESPTGGQLVGASLEAVVSCTHSAGVRHVSFFIDRTSVNEVSEPGNCQPCRVPLTLSGFTDGTHSLKVVATAGNGDTGESSTQVVLDLTPPEVQLLSPLGGERFVGLMQVQARAHDPGPAGEQPVAGLEVLLDEALLSSQPGGPPEQLYELEIDVGSILTGNRTLKVAATDAAGNAGSAQVEVRIVTVPQFRAVVPTVVDRRSNVTDLAVVDEDGDGNPDVLVMSRNGLFALRGDGAGGLNEPVLLLESGAAELMLVADLDGDGLLELIRAGRLSGSGPAVEVHRRSASGGWSVAGEQHELAETPTCLKLGLIDGDERLDLLVGGDSDETALGMLPGLDCSEPGSDCFSEVQYSGGVTRVRSIDVGDLDGDGNNDVVVGRAATFFSVFPGRGDGSFGIPRDTGPGDGCLGQAMGVAFGDYDEDGVLDLAVTQATTGGSLPSAVAVYMGGGQGDWQFSLADRVFEGSVAPGPHEVIGRDLNEDGHLDLLVVNYDARNVSVMLGKGDASFEEREMFNLGPAPARARLVDMNSDGLLDLVYLNITEGMVSLQLGRGEGRFSGAPELRLEGRPVDLVPVRLSPTGRADLVVVGEAETAAGDKHMPLAIAHNDGTHPRFPPTWSEIDITGQGYPKDARAGDLTGDSLEDLVVVTDSVCLTNNCRPTTNLLIADGAGGLSAHYPMLFSERLAAVALCDVDGDGRPDLLGGYPTYTDKPPAVAFGLVRKVEPGAEPGTPPVTIVHDALAVLSGDPADVQCARINDDEHNDYLSVNTRDGSLNYFKGNSSLPYVQGERQVLAIGERPRRLAIADVDADGSPDAVASVDGNVAIAFGAPGGETFETSTFLTRQRMDPWGVAVEDFTDDGLPDVAVIDRSELTVSVYVNAGGREFIGPVDFYTSLGPTELVSADFNSDGCSDLAALNRNGLSVTLLLAEGARCVPSP